MKNRYVIIILILFLNQSNIDAQTLNWSATQKDRHVLSAHFGMEHGVVYGVGYSHRLKNQKIPMALEATFSAPTGSTVFDDFKTKMGIEANLLHWKDLRAIAKAQGVFRRYESGFARLLNFGSDLSVTVGYYKPKWFVSGEVGFDKAIITHFRHSAIYKQQYPGAVDGWAQPATGGFLYYGLTAGYSFKKEDIFFKAGKMLAQDLHNPTSFPLYSQLGMNFKW